MARMLLQAGICSIADIWSAVERRWLLLEEVEFLFGVTYLTPTLWRSIITNISVSFDTILLRDQWCFFADDFVSFGSFFPCLLDGDRPMMRNSTMGVGQVGHTPFDLLSPCRSAEFLKDTKLFSLRASDDSLQQFQFDGAWPEWIWLERIRTCNIFTSDQSDRLISLGGIQSLQWDPAARSWPLARNFFDISVAAFRELLRPSLLPRKFTSVERWPLPASFEPPWKDIWRRN